MQSQPTNPSITTNNMSSATNNTTTAKTKKTLTQSFERRHIGPSNTKDLNEMLKVVGSETLAEFTEKVVPAKLRTKKDLSTEIEQALSEQQAIDLLKKISLKNKVFRSHIGMGYYGTHTPYIIARNILENPSWYTQYTPYQAEIAQGRLEALLNFQTMVSSLTGFEIANASLLDEGTAAAEAMSMSQGISEASERNKFFISADCHPQTISVVKTRAEAIGVDVVIGKASEANLNEIYGMLLQYPATDGSAQNYKSLIAKAKENKVIVTVATDLLALTMLTPPAELGAHIAVGNTQRFGIPFGFGGPHAAFFATLDQFKRQIPGRIIGVSKDTAGRRALRLALQTREQHIRREKATSNICTAQVLLAVMAGMYAVYHGPDGIKEIAERVHLHTKTFALFLKQQGYKLANNSFFDTLTVVISENDKKALVEKAAKRNTNLGAYHLGALQISFDETTTEDDVKNLMDIFNANINNTSINTKTEDSVAELGIPSELKRTTPFLKDEIFNKYHTETELLRYIKSLENKDLSLVHSMIPLGSCTMKLNATAEMLPVSWAEFANVHPFAPAEQTKGYATMFADLEKALCKVTGFAKTSLQPNAGSAGEYAGLLTIRKYLRENNQAHRTICLIPKSAHGTNPASAVMAGMTVVPVECDKIGNIDLKDLEQKVAEHKDNLACLMVTFPSTHGVFEEGIKKATKLVHDAGAQVYMDGANLNALVGLVRPLDLGMDVCHINLHKTFCIPHGGGGPGMGPICVAKHLAPYIPNHPVVTSVGTKEGCGPISAAPWGSASILVIPWMYIKMMGGDGLTTATEIGILNANYVAKRLQHAYPVLYTGKTGYVAHECILDCRGFKDFGVEVEDIAKRLMDYGFHAPTMSWPVAGTLMVEPTESESKAELDRFCDAMLSIFEEIQEVKSGAADKDSNVLKQAPHPLQDIITDNWIRAYSREKAAYPLAWTRERKFWPSVSRIDAAFGDRNLVCTCGDVSDYVK